MSLRENEYRQSYLPLHIMIDGLFYGYCEQVNLGVDPTEIFARFRDAPYLVSTITTRRDANTGEIIEQFPVIVVDFDSTTTPVVIPPSVWIFAFETMFSEFRLRPDVTMQVALVSNRKGWVILGAISLLLLVAQDLFPLRTLSAEDEKKLVAKWARFHALQERWQALPRREFEPFPRCFPGACLLLKRATVEAMVGNLEQGAPAALPDVLKSYIKEVWVFSTPRGTGADAAQDGDPWAWELRYARDPTTDREVASWANSPRLRRNAVVGEYYKYNYQGLIPPGERTYGWKDFRAEFAKPEWAYLPYLGEVTPPQEFPPDPDSFQRLGMPEHMAEFREFYRADTKKELELVEWHPPFVLFREVGGKVLVSVCHPPYEGWFYHAAGMQGIRALLGKVPARYFVHHPGQSIIEHDSMFMQQLANNDLTGYGDWRGASDQVARLQGEHLFVDFLLPGVFRFADYIDRLDEGSIAGWWFFNKELKIFDPALGGDKEKLKVLVEVAKLAKKQETMHPAVYHYELKALTAKSPESAALFASIMDSRDSDEESEDGEDEEEESEDEDDEGEESEEEKEEAFQKNLKDWF